MPAVQLPGRETRFRELAFVRLEELVREAATALAPLLDRPVALFGYSMGALAAFELAREWRRRGLPAPALLCAAAHAAPHRPPRGRALHALPDAEFRAELRRLEGTPTEILDNDELLQAFLPTLRADFAVCENYVCRDEPPLDVPIAVCGGWHDARAGFDDLNAWRIHTDREFSIRLFPGGHFFLNSQRGELLSFLNEQLTAAHRENDPWTPAESPPSLGDDVHVWLIDLDDKVGDFCRLERSLSDEELRRAERLQFPNDRRRFIVGRGTLRAILGRYLGCEPAAIPLWYNPQGKPSLPPSLPDSGVQFNLAHSDRLALLAVTRGRAVGVDIERMKAEVEYLELADRYFSPAESAALRSRPAAMQRVAFFAGWTRKEAYLKAHGVGLALPMDQFSVSLPPDDPPRLVSTEHDPSQRDRWELLDLAPAEGFAAAVAIEGRGPRVQRLRWVTNE